MELRSHIESGDFAGIFVMGSRHMGWHEVFKQRPHHIADYLMARGYLVICAMNPVYPADFTPVARRENESLFLVNFDDRSVWSDVIKIIAAANAPKFYHLVGTEPGTTPDEIRKLKSAGFHIFYDYLDEISPDINQGINPMCFERHDMLLRDPDVLLVASADTLYKKGLTHRRENVVFAPNGVRLEDWESPCRAEPPSEMVPIIRQGKPIVGYYGSFASWMNYDYVRALSEGLPDMNLVMIGYDYDWGKGPYAQSGIANLPNVHIIGPQKYERLKEFSRYFAVGIIPFRDYDVTQSVSPVKMFEYMAQGIPPIASGLMECKKYASCLTVSSGEEYVRAVRRAIKLRTDKEYLEQLRRDARANTWTERGRVIEAAMSTMVSSQRSRRVN